jgi:hypothetical protein
MVKPPSRRSSLSSSTNLYLKDLAIQQAVDNPVQSPHRPVYVIQDEDEEEKDVMDSGVSLGGMHDSAIGLESSTPPTPIVCAFPSTETPTIRVEIPTTGGLERSSTLPTRRPRSKTTQMPRRVSSLNLPFTLPTSPVTIQTQRKLRCRFWERVVHLNPNHHMDHAGYRADHHWEVMERILFLYSKLNPGVGYVQGMNEILAPLYWVMAQDVSEEEAAHAEADTFFCFTTLMSVARDNFLKSMDGDASGGIGANLKRLESLLQRRDPEIWLDLELKALHPTYYAFRWLTVLCCQEWPLHDVVRLWDSILSDPPYGFSSDSISGHRDHQLNFLLDFCCAMILCVRDQLLAEPFAENLTMLQNYPIHDISIILEKAYDIRHLETSIEQMQDRNIYDDSDRFSIRSFTSGFSNFSGFSGFSFAPVRRAPSRASSITDATFFNHPQPQPQQELPAPLSRARSQTFMEVFRQTMSGSPSSTSSNNTVTSPLGRSSTMTSATTSPTSTASFWQRMIKG